MTNMLSIEEQCAIYAQRIMELERELAEARDQIAKVGVSAILQGRENEALRAENEGLRAAAEAIANELHTTAPFCGDMRDWLFGFRDRLRAALNKEPAK
jgi:regulator of replication initiation timing